MQEADQKFPQNTELIASEESIHYLQGNYEKAIECAKRLIANFPDK